MTKEWVHGVGHSPVCQILSQIVVRAVITSSPPVWTNSDGMFSTLAEFPFSFDCTASSIFLRRMERSAFVSVWGQSSADGFPFALWLYSSVQYSVHRFSIFRFSVRRFPERSWTVVACPCLKVVKSFTSWYALLLLFSLRFSSNLTPLFSYPIFFCLFQAPLDFAVRFPVLLRSFRFESFLSQFSPFVAQIKNS